MATSVRDRIFAWVGVAVIAISVAALSVAVIIQNIASSSAANSSTNSTQNAISCADNNAEPTDPAPTVYTTTQPVSDLQVTDLSQGTGAAAKSGDCLVVKYYGTLAKDGTVFDETYTKPSAFAFTLGQGQVIQGWDKGLVGIRVGGERRLVIPAAMAYGNQGQGSIPANSDLVFVVKLLRIQ